MKRILVARLKPSLFEKMRKDKEKGEYNNWETYIKDLFDYWHLQEVLE
jgi:hypothetical protein